MICATYANIRNCGIPESRRATAFPNAHAPRQQRHSYRLASQLRTVVPFARPVLFLFRRVPVRSDDDNNHTNALLVQ